MFSCFYRSLPEHDPRFESSFSRTILKKKKKEKNHEIHLPTERKKDPWIGNFLPLRRGWLRSDRIERKEKRGGPRRQQCAIDISTFWAARLLTLGAEGARASTQNWWRCTDRSARFEGESNRPRLSCYRPLRVIKFPVVFTGQWPRPGRRHPIALTTGRNSYRGYRATPPPRKLEPFAFPPSIFFSLLSSFPSSEGISKIPMI